MQLDEESKKKLEYLNNPQVEAVIEKYASLCKPKNIIVFDDSKADLERIRKISLEKGEEKELALKGHTVHFDNILDQGRDLANTRVLVKKGVILGKAIATIDRDAGLKEVFELMEGIMKGRDMYVKFYCLGPENSKFAIPSLQLTDSAYVCHSEDLLYRQGYKEFKKQKKFFHFVHSCGRMEDCKSVEMGLRRVYMDLDKERVFSINCQYAGNSVGLKKLALRLAISKAHKEDWLCEHMFIMGAQRNNRITYFAGAFPSACGKTSTAMIPGQTIIGDDIAYIRINNGIPKAVNVEQGLFGIIRDVNPKDDPLIYKALITKGEIIFSNVLVRNNVPYWLGMGKDIPKIGINYSGEWFEGKKQGSIDISPAHKNARYTLKIKELENADKNLDNPEGVEISGLIYGGRDSDTNVPVLQSLNWQHGVFLGSILESETTSAAIGQEGIRKHNPMSNVEFLVVPLSTYISNHLKFGQDVKKQPLIFTTNYFLKENDKFLNDKMDKKVWLMWMEGRVNNDFDAIETPVGFIPKYEDLRALFKEFLDKAYPKEDYEKQFSIRTKNYVEKMDRIEAIFKGEENIPKEFYTLLKEQRERLL